MIAKVKLDDELLLAELEELFRAMPSQGSLAARHQEAMPWLGRAAALFELVDPRMSIPFSMIQNDLLSGRQFRWEPALAKLTALLHQARHTLVLRTEGPRSTAIAAGKVFSYFEELRKIVETAKSDLLVVDPYLDADFVSNYLIYVSTSAKIRLLTKDPKCLSRLLPAVKLFNVENGNPISVRSTATIHDRYVIVDHVACFQSGASIKDGAKHAPTTVTEIVDAFSAVQSTYETIWASSKSEL